MSTYLILPANASHDVYPDNSNHNYKIKLPERLQILSGEWEIALRSITYPNNWHNVAKQFVLFINTETKRSLTCTVPDGKYKSVSDVTAMLNQLSSRQPPGSDVSFRYSATTGNTIIKHRKKEIMVLLSKDLANILGFDTKQYTVPTDDYDRVSANTSNIDGQYDNLYVYCNLCNSRVVGDSNVPLLHNVPVRGRTGASNLVHEIVKSPVYVPVANADTDTVEIDIRRGDGEPVLFKGGCVIVTVHLRKI